MAQDFLQALQPQTSVNELGTLHHNTISRKLDNGEVVIETRPTLSGSTKVASGDYGRGAFIHREAPLFVSEDEIATSLAATSITSTEINPNATASFSILDSGSNRITIVQNAGYDGNYGNIYYASDSPTFQIDDYFYDSILDVSSQSASPVDLSFSDDGVYLYVTDLVLEEIFQYSLSVPWEITTATYTGNSYDFTADISGVMGWGKVVNNGTLVYVASSANIIYEFPLGTAYDISTVGTVNDTFSVATQVGTLGGLYISPDGTKVYALDFANDDVEEYTMSGAFDLTTISYASKTLDLSSESTGDWEDMTLSNSLGKLYAMTSFNVVYEYSLTAGDLSTGSYASRNKDLSPDTSGSVYGIMMRESGDSLYACTGDDDVYKFDVTQDFTKVSDAQSPGTPSETIMIRGCPVLNGYVYVADINGNIYNCDNGDVSSWQAINVIAAERKPDFGCCIAEHKDHIINIGTRSIEFFYDAGLTNGSPLQRRQDIYYNIGCCFPNSVTQQGDSLFFIGTDSNGDTDIYVLEQFNLSPLGNEYIKTLLRNLDTPRHKNLYTSSPVAFQQLLVAYSTPNNGTCLALTINGTSYNYCLNTGLISKWYPGADPASSTGMFTSNWNTNELFPITGIYSHTAQGSTAYAIFANGYTSSFTYNSDLKDVGGSTAAGSFFYLPKWNAETLQRKRIHWYMLHQYPNLDSSITSSTVTIEWVDLDNSNDFGAALTDADFTQARTITSNYSTAMVYRCGITRERVHKITFTPEKSQLIKGLEIDYDLLRR